MRVTTATENDMQSRKIVLFFPISKNQTENDKHHAKQCFLYFSKQANWQNKNITRKKKLLHEI